MAKTYVDTVKYSVKAKVWINGLVEKPDVVGAIFGQTEGLLGEDLDLRELQKSGRIGRIEVDIEAKKGKTEGYIIVPSSLDKAETAIIAAALETVDRVGPCDAKIEIEAVEDTRAKKREFIVNRAKELLRKLIEEKLPESKELADVVKAEVRQAEIVEYGPERIPAGPEIDSSEDIIIVEGRADVLNLLRHGFKNVISLKGSKIPKTVVELSKRKTATLFVDGDRGGDIITREMAELADIDFVARAPDGKEVEELTKKEIIKAIRSKLPLHQYLAIRGIHVTGKETGRKQEKPEEGKPKGKEEARERKTKTDSQNGLEKELEQNFYRIKDTMKAVFLDNDLNVLKEVSVADMIKEIKPGIFAIVFDGIVTQRLVDIANRNKIRYLVGLKAARIRPSNVKVLVSQ